MKYFFVWLSEKYNHKYTAPIEADNFNEAVEKFNKIHGTDGVIVDIQISIECQVPSGNDVLGRQKGSGENFSERY
jgi:hypothetical protein